MSGACGALARHRALPYFQRPKFLELSEEALQRDEAPDGPRNPAGHNGRHAVGRVQPLPQRVDEGSKQHERFSTDVPEPDQEARSNFLVSLPKLDMVILIGRPAQGVAQVEVRAQEPGQQAQQALLPAAPH